MNDLKEAHQKEIEILKASMASAGRSRFAKKRTPEEQAELLEKQLSVIREKHEKEIAELAQYLEQVNLQPESEDKDKEHKTVEEQGGNDGSDGNGTAEVTNNAADDDKNSDAVQAKKLKAQKRRERAAKKYGLDQDITAAGPNLAEQESQEFAKMLHRIGYEVKSIPGDGHCLFRAVESQLHETASSRGIRDVSTVPDYQKLRSLAADYIRRHGKELVWFITWSKADKFPDNAHELDPSDPSVMAALERYCTRLETTPAWGGHIELRALANATGCPIVVYQVNSPALEFFPDGVEGTGKLASLEGDVDGKILRLSYHKHLVATGEHYNSVVKKTKSDA